jgi:hypothetical protein
MPLQNYKGRYKGLYMAIITIPNIIKTNSFGTGKVTNIGIIKDTDAVQHASPSTTKSKDEPNTRFCLQSSIPK